MSRRSSGGATEVSQTWDETLIRGLVQRRVPLFGAGVLALALITLAGLLELLALPLLASWAQLCYRLFGWGIYPLCLLLVLVGVQLMFRGVNHRF